MPRPIPPISPGLKPTATTITGRRTGRLAAVTCLFNPCGYRRLRENYFRFRQQLNGCPLFTAEVSFDGQFQLGADWEIHAHPGNRMWQKEQLINWMIERLPDQFDQVAWIDADMLFLNPNWAAETSALLDQFPVVQLYETCHYTTKHGFIDHAYPSLLRKRKQGLSHHGQPGGAWAARREFLTRHGLYSRNIVGGGDVCLTDALFGQFHGYITTISPPALVADFRRWAREVHAAVRGNVGCVSGDIVHLFHGTEQNRRYVQRAEMLCKNAFDPQADVRIGNNGLLEWASAKPALHAGLAEYFVQRREDD